MSDPPLPITFEPEYGSVVTRVLPGIPAMMTLCAGFFLVVGSATGLALAAASLAVAVAAGPPSST